MHREPIISVKKFLTLSLISLSLIILFFNSTDIIYTINAQVFEFNEDDYFDTEEEKGGEDKEENPSSTTSSNSAEDTSATKISKDMKNKPLSSSSSNYEDTDKEVCIDKQKIEPISSLSNSDLSSDSYSSNFHFIKKFYR